MKGSLVVIGVATALAFTCSVGNTRGPQQHPVDAPTLVFAHEADYREVAPGVSRAVLWGDRERGSYGAFTHYEPDFDTGVHKHTEDVWIVVIQGTYVYMDDAGETRVERGEFMRIPGGTSHRSGGGAEWGAVIYEESSAGVTDNAGGVQSKRQIQGQENSPTIVSLDKADFKEVAPGVSRAVLWGDYDKGYYGAFTEFEPEVDAGVHTYTNDIWIVVIQGFYLYRDDAGEKRLGPGDYMRIGGGTRHQSAGDKKWGVVFYEASDGK